MLKKILIAAATAVALAGTAVATAAPAAAAPTTTIEVSWKGGHGDWKRHGGKHRGHKKWSPRRACQPIIRWKKVGYRYHRRWQPVVVGWDCHRGRGGYKYRKWH